MNIHMNIKKILSIPAVMALFLLPGCSRYTIYSVGDRPRTEVGGGVVYALPSTQLLITLYCHYTDRTQAPYADYAEELLGYTGGEPLFGITGAEISSRVVPDHSHIFYVVPRGTSIQVEDLLLKSVGMGEAAPARNYADEEDGTTPSYPSQQRQQLPEYNLTPRSDTLYRRGDKPGSPSYVRQSEDIRTLRQQAKDAAKEIRQTQMRRQELADGEGGLSGDALQAELQRLDQRLAELWALFIGTRTTKTLQFSLSPQPVRGETVTHTSLLFYTPELGIVDSSYAGADTLTLTITSLNTLRDAARFVNYRADGPSLKRNKWKNVIQYRLAEKTLVEVACPGLEVKKPVPILQFGPVMALPRQTRRALFDTHTGSLLYIEE